MSRYTNCKVNISEGQKDKIKRALQAGTGVSIKLSHSDLNGEHLLALTQAQINKLAKAYQDGKGVTIKMSKTQLINNTKVEGGFIGAILPFLATAGKFLLSSVLPSLATGALTGIGAAAGSKVIDKVTGKGEGIYLNTRGKNYKIVQQGQGLYMKPYQGSGLNGVGEGLYLKRGNGFVNGEGLILGPDSPFKNIPLLGLLL